MINHKLVWNSYNFTLPFWAYLLPLTALLAWQDFKERQVNAGTAIATLIALALGAYYFSHIAGMLCILGAYRCFRKNSIQPIDIAVFSFGAGYFSLEFLSVYCLITALVLAFMFKVTKEPKLPFVFAWALAFWAAYFLHLTLE